MIAINLYGGPGTGKSTTAAHLFALMKHKGYVPELITEFAKELTYDNRHDILDGNQMLVTGTQYEKMRRMSSTKVDCIITDSPLLLGSVFCKPELRDAYDHILYHHYREFDNLNIFLVRQKAYCTVGRSQSEDEAVAYDDIIRRGLEMWDDYHEVVADEHAAQNILKIWEAAR